MKKKKVLIITSKYNKTVSIGLQRSASVLLSKFKWIQTFNLEVPGAFEIPSVIEKNINKFDGVVALGCIIKGETNNFDLISKTITSSLMYLSIKHKKPIGNAVITCLNNKQALARRKKGREAANAVKEILLLDKKLKIKS